MWEAYKFYSDSEDIERDSDGTITVCFGSQGADITLRLIDAEAETLFGFGHCAILAWELHKATGIPLAVFDSKKESLYGGWSGHVALQLADGRFFDINGASTKEELLRHYSGSLVEEPRLMNDADFIDLMTDETNRHDPKQYLCELEQLVLADFVEFLQEKYAAELSSSM